MTMLCNSQPHLIFSNPGLTHGAVWDTLRVLRLLSGTTSLVSFSAYDDHTAKQALVRLAADAFISKSALAVAFADKITSFFARADSVLVGHGTPNHIEHEVGTSPSWMRPCGRDVADLG